ncbi:hypothetical protein SAMN06295960_3897 [Paenibacillus aquistagni]|uniref:Uncharacterized protein n=1 Tax=Paenibacillus aquistagni TaxID=1852522 RepID=A0A1X7LNJ4_9BACL|nr:hypothetical protein SAMN06295960_3897 [Paenibacillus aquistagni]
MEAVCKLDKSTCDYQTQCSRDRYLRTLTYKCTYSDGMTGTMTKYECSC